MSKRKRTKDLQNTTQKTKPYDRVNNIYKTLHRKLNIPYDRVHNIM